MISFMISKNILNLSIRLMTNIIVKVDLMRLNIIFRKWNNNHVMREMVEKKTKGLL